MFKCGLAGAWHVHFDKYARMIKERTDCEITCLWDDDHKRGLENAEKFGAEFVSDYDQFINRDDVQGIIVCSSTNMHTDLIIKAAQAKKHVFTEKVLCFTESDAQKIKQAVVESGIKFCISFPYRSDPRMLFAKQVIENGTLGTITYARVRNAHTGASDNWLPQFFYDKQLCGGGAMIDLGAHPMYLLLYYLGTPKSVTSIFTGVTGKEVEDNALSVVEFENGCIGTAETSFVSKYSPMYIEISGTKGSLRLGGPHKGVEYNTEGEWVTAEKLPEPLKHPIEQWLDGILYGGEIQYTIDDAVNLTKLMEKAYESQTTGHRVSFAESDKNQTATVCTSI